MQKQFLILTGAAVVAVGVHASFGFAQGPQAPALPPDINSVTLSRFAPVTPANLDAEGQKALAARTNPPNPGPGPGAAGSYSPRTSEGRPARPRAGRAIRPDFSGRRPHLPARRPEITAR